MSDSQTKDFLFCLFVNISPLDLIIIIMIVIIIIIKNYNRITNFSQIQKYYL